VPGIGLEAVDLPHLRFDAGAKGGTPGRRRLAEKLLVFVFRNDIGEIGILFVG
jgi:hypothetical protein